MPQPGAGVRGLACPAPMGSAVAQRLQVSSALCPRCLPQLLAGKPPRTCSSRSLLLGKPRGGRALCQWAGCTCPLFPRGHGPLPGSQFGPPSQPPGPCLSHRSLATPQGALGCASQTLLPALSDFQTEPLPLPPQGKSAGVWKRGAAHWKSHTQAPKTLCHGPEDADWLERGLSSVHDHLPRSQHPHL